MYRLVRSTLDGDLYITGAVRSIRAADGFDFEAETSSDRKAAADFPQYMDARGFQLRLALDGFRIEATEDGLR